MAAVDTVGMGLPPTSQVASHGEDAQKSGETQPGLGVWEPYSPDIPPGAIHFWLDAIKPAVGLYQQATSPDTLSCLQITLANLHVLLS